MITIRAHIESYSHRDTAQPLIERVEMSVSGGSPACLLGASGVGKTTFLSVLADLAAGHLIGSVRYDIDGVELDAREVRSRGWLGLLSQRPALLPWLTVRKNLLLPAVVSAVLPLPSDDQMTRWLEQLGLPASTLELMPDQLSGGIHQRVAVARTLLYKPRVVLLDEALNALDSASADLVMEAIGEFVVNTRAALLLVTHDTARALRHSEQVYFLSSQGRMGLIQQPTTEAELHARLATDIKMQSFSTESGGNP